MISSLPRRVFFVLLVSVTLLGGSLASAQTFVDRRSDDAFRVVSYNVYFDDLFDGQQPGDLNRMINAVDADVYNFQEAFSTSSTEVLNVFNTLAPLADNRSWQVHKGRNQLIVSRHGLSSFETNVPGGRRGIAMALVDLPDAHFSNDLYLLNNHFPCCDTGEDGRLVESRAINDWIADAMSPGGNVTLAPNTAISVLGDLNIVGGPEPLNILVDGEGNAPDWDGTSLTNALPVHNASGTDTFTWRNDQLIFDPGVLDYILYTDSVLEAEYGFVLNPSTMTADELSLTGLVADDFKVQQFRNGAFVDVFDHLPVVVDFVAPTATSSVPEPTALAGLALGLAGVIVRRRKR